MKKLQKGWDILHTTSKIAHIIILTVKNLMNHKFNPLVDKKLADLEINDLLSLQEKQNSEGRLTFFGRLTCFANLSIGSILKS